MVGKYVSLICGSAVPLIFCPLLREYSSFIAPSWKYLPSSPPRSFLPMHSLRSSEEGGVVLSWEAACSFCRSGVTRMTPRAQPLIRTVTREVRPPSTHRQPLVQSHCPAINKESHLHKLTGTQCSRPAHPQGLHTHTDIH